MGGVAIVTGGAQGIGRGIVEELVNGGFHAVVADRSEEDSERIRTDLADAVSSHVVDVTDAQDVVKLFDIVGSEHGQLDVLVNNAARTIYGPATEFQEPDWDETMLSVKGYFLCSREAAKLMRPRRRGKIINISSIAAHVGLARTVAHATAKGGVEAMTRVLAVEFAPYNVQVNAVAPGPVETPGSRTVLTKQELEQRRKRIPLGRLGTPTDVAGIVAFLASDRSDWVTGSVIVVDGGYTILGAGPGDPTLSAD
jgi:NAD(P)-dependent dehydrogenase (short-subunit alcohol dehydrogenase family)